MVGDHDLRCRAGPRRRPRPRPGPVCGSIAAAVALTVPAPLGGCCSVLAGDVVQELGRLAEGARPRRLVGGDLDPAGAVGGLPIAAAVLAVPARPGPECAVRVAVGARDHTGVPWRRSDPPPIASRG